MNRRVPYDKFSHRWTPMAFVGFQLFAESTRMFPPVVIPFRRRHQDSGSAEVTRTDVLRNQSM
jgi:hypothetical protein